MAAYIFKLQVTNLSFDRRTFCTSLSSVEIHFQLNRYFTTFIVFSTSRLFIYLCTTFIKRIIHNLICSDALCMRNNVQGTFHIMFCKFMQFNKIFKTIFEYIRKKFRFVHTNTFCEYRKKLRASPRVHLVLEGFILYKNDIVIARLLWEIYTCMNIPMRKFKILSNFLYSGILQYMTMKFHLLRH